MSNSSHGGIESGMRLKLITLSVYAHRNRSISSFSMRPQLKRDSLGRHSAEPVALVRLYWCPVPAAVRKGSRPGAPDLTRRMPSETEHPADGHVASLDSLPDLTPNERLPPQRGRAEPAGDPHLGALPGRLALGNAGPR